MGRWSSASSRCCPRANKEVSVALQRLTRAGFRDETCCEGLLRIKVVRPFSCALIAAVTGSANMGPFFVYLMALGGGFSGAGFLAGKEDLCAPEEDHARAARCA